MTFLLSDIQTKEHCVVGAGHHLPPSLVLIWPPDQAKDSGTVTVPGRRRPPLHDRDSPPTRTTDPRSTGSVPGRRGLTWLSLAIGSISVLGGFKQDRRCAGPGQPRLRRARRVCEFLLTRSCRPARVRLPTTRSPSAATRSTPDLDSNNGAGTMHHSDASQALPIPPALALFLRGSCRAKTAFQLV